MSTVTNALSRVIQFLRKWMRCTSVDEAGEETLTTNVLANEILLHIFRFLEYDDLINVEQVCSRWKAVVETCFATEKWLSLRFTPGNYTLKRMKRYGSSIQTLQFGLGYRAVQCANDKFNWAEEFANRFPRLITLDLSGIPMSNDDLKYLSTKCCQLTNITLRGIRFTAEGLRMFLQALPGMKVLRIFGRPDFQFEDLIQPNAVSAVFSTCRSLQTFEISGPDTFTDTACFSKFCKECVSLRRLVISRSQMPNEIFAQIQHCSLLEELQLLICPNIDVSTLIEISKGCPNLRSVSLIGIPFIGENGLKCFSRSRNLNFFETDCGKVTDETLVELSKCVNLRKVKLSWCPRVSDRGCAALLAHCPQLQMLHVEDCKGVTNVTVDSAIKAVQCRLNGLVLQFKIRDTSVMHST